MPDQEKLVSIALPVYNGADYIGEAIDSALLQTYAGFELIISDNASADATEEICRRYASRDARIRYHRHQENRGGAWNAKFALEQARGYYFTMLAHDDTLKPDFLKRTMRFLESHPSCILVSGDIETIDEGGSVIRIDELEKIRDSIPWKQRMAMFFRYPVSKIFFCVYGIMKTEDARRLFSFQEGKKIIKGSEMPLLARIAASGEIVALPEVLRTYRQHSKSSSNMEVARLKRGPLLSQLKTKLLLMHNLYSIRWYQAKALWGSPYPLSCKLGTTGKIYGGYIKEFCRRVSRLPRKITSRFD